MVEFYGKRKENIYLDNGASTLSLQKVKEAGDDFLLEYGSIHRGSGENSAVSTRKYEEARETILRLIHGGAEDCLIFTANTTDAINKFTLLHQEKGTVLLCDIEHTANYLPWIRRMKKVQEFSPENFVITPSQIEEELSKNSDIRLVALAAASNITGYIVDYPAIYEICKKHQAYLFLDASQLAPHKRPDLRFCDVLAYCGHKMYAPFGAGILAGRKSLLSQIGNSLTGGGNVLYVDSVLGPIYKEAPFVHEAGTPNGIGAVTLAKAHEVLYQEFGDNFLYKHNESLLVEMKAQKEKLIHAGYEVYFLDLDIEKTPVMIIDNKKKSNAETCDLLNKEIEGYRRVFVREGAFCAYRILEKIKPSLCELKNKVQNKKLHPAYSLIRLSAGLINDPEDIKEAVNKLVYINQI